MRLLSVLLAFICLTLFTKVMAEESVICDASSGECNTVGTKSEMAAEAVHEPISASQETAKHAGLKAVVLGGTGEIGRKLVVELINSNKFVRVVSLQRRKVDYFPKSDKLEQVIVDNFDELEAARFSHLFVGMDIAFNAFGTTRKDAGGADEFRRIDFGYSAKFAQQCNGAKVPRVHLVTAVGSNKDSWFLYPEVKGKLEELYTNYKFQSLSIWRPGLLDRENPRFIEKLALYVMRGIPVAQVAQAIRMRAEQIEEDSASTPDGLVEIFSDSDMYAITEQRTT